MPNANSFPDGQRGRIRKDDASRVGDYAASALPVGGPGMLRRRFPQGSTCFPLPTRSVTTSNPPFTILKATNQANPGRVRIVNGMLGGLLPDEMSVPDLVLPDGTDNHCYLAMDPSGTNYIYGKVLVDGDTGLFTDSDVYSVTSQEQADGDYCYLQIGSVSYDGTTLKILSQDAVGNQSLLVACSADGTVLQPFWSAG